MSIFEKHVLSQLLYVTSFLLSFTSRIVLLNEVQGTSLVVQWLRLNLPIQGVWIWSLVGQEPKITHALWAKNQNIKQKPYCNKFNKDFKNGPH